MNEQQLRKNLESYIQEKIDNDFTHFYGFELANATNKMDTNTLYKFCSYISNMEQKYNKEYSSVRTMARIGELFNLGFDERQIDETKYTPKTAFYEAVRSYMSDISYYNQYRTLPPKQAQPIQMQKQTDLQLQPKQTQQVQKQTDEQLRSRMNEIIKKYNLQKDRVFFDHCFADGNIPAQGWKLHVAADSLEKYCEMMEVMIPELMENNVQFKVVAPEHFLQQFDGKNIWGKEFTIYPTDNFDLSRFSKKFRDLLSETPTRQSQSDQYFGCRLTARFGGFTKRDTMDKDGCRYRDDRTPGKYSPDWIGDTTLNDVLAFQKNIKDKLAQTGDFKLYLQEYMQGFESKKGDQYLFNEYAFRNFRQAYDLQQQTMQEGSLLHMFGLYIVVAPTDQKERLNQYCNMRGYRPMEIKTTNSLGTIGDIDTLINAYSGQSSRNQQNINRINNLETTR